jgi:hypothetical protein
MVLQSRRTIKNVIGLYPTRSLRRSPDSFGFYAFCTNRTAFAALIAMEDVFTEFYMDTSILPLISPLPYRFFREPDLLPKRIVKDIRTRGVMLYAPEE